MLQKIFYCRFKVSFCNIPFLTFFKKNREDNYFTLDIKNIVTEVSMRAFEKNIRKKYNSLEKKKLLRKKITKQRV